jgi:hypothetical protein
VGIKRIVDTSFWTDGKVDDFSPEDKYFMLYLLTNPFSTQLGIYEISIKQVAFQMGYSVDAVKVLIDRFESKYKMILFSPETNEIAIKNFLRHSIIKGGAPVRDCLIKEIKKVKNRDLIARVFAHIKDSESLNETVKKIIAEYEEKNGALLYTNEKDNENENDNDNEVSCPDTGNESLNDSSEQPATKPKQKKTVKHKHGEFQNVLLTDSEFEKLAVDFGVDLRGKAISFLDSYIEEKGYKSKSHNLAIRRWVIDAVKENESKPKRYGRKEPVPGWAQPSLGSAELEAIQEALKNDPVTVGNSPELAERAEILRQKIQGG